MNRCYLAAIALATVAAFWSRIGTAEILAVVLLCLVVIGRIERVLPKAQP
jgi:hypothetical protein